MFIKNKDGIKMRKNSKPNCSELCCWIWHSLDIFEEELTVKGRNVTHTVNDINKLNDTIIGIDLYMATN
jgi:hypothetical protein